MTLTAGFTDPVTESQACFRAVLAAMASPGAIHAARAPGPAPLDPATAAVLLTLLDAETSCWLDTACAAARDWIAFHSGAPVVARAHAAFVIAGTMPDLADLPAGSDEEPEAGATLVLQVAALGRGQCFRLAGPGLAAPTTLAVTGLPANFAAQWRDNHGRFPRGVDLILCAGDQLAALPRSVAVEAV